MATITIRRLTRSGDEALTVEPGDLASALPGALKNSAAAVRVGGGEARYVGTDPALIRAVVENEVAAGAERVEVLVFPPIAGG